MTSIQAPTKELQSKLNSNLSLMRIGNNFLKISKSTIVMVGILNSAETLDTLMKLESVSNHLTTNQCLNNQSLIQLTSQHIVIQLYLIREITRKGEEVVRVNQVALAVTAVIVRTGNAKRSLRVLQRGDQSLAVTERKRRSIIGTLAKIAAVESSSLTLSENQDW